MYQLSKTKEGRGREIRRWVEASKMGWKIEDYTTVNCDDPDSIPPLEPPPYAKEVKKEIGRETKKGKGRSSGSKGQKRPKVGDIIGEYDGKPIPKRGHRISDIHPEAKLSLIDTLGDGTYEGDRRAQRDEMERLWHSGDETLPPLIDAEVISDLARDELPADILPTIEHHLQDYCERYGVEDLSKCSGLQWMGACYYVGRWIKSSELLRDKNRPGGDKGGYIPERVEALIQPWVQLCGIYNHVPLMSDFMAMSGVDMEWLYNLKDGRDNRARERTREKLEHIEDSGLGSGLMDTQGNPTGRIFYSKARRGWRETSEVLHRHTIEAAVGVEALPKLEA